MSFWRGEYSGLPYSFLKAAWCSVAYISYHLYSQFPSSGHLGCFNLFLFPTVHTCASISAGQSLKGRIIRWKLHNFSPWKLHQSTLPAMSVSHCFSYAPTNAECLSDRKKYCLILILAVTSIMSIIKHLLQVNVYFLFPPLATFEPLKLWESGEYQKENLPVFPNISLGID